MESENIINYVGVNNKQTLLLIGFDNGFRIYNLLNFNLLCTQLFNGGIGAIDCLENTNILVLTGGGKFPNFAHNEAIIWDHSKKCINAELVFNKEIFQVKFKYEHLIAITSETLFIYLTFENLKKIKEIDICIFRNRFYHQNLLDYPSIIAYAGQSIEFNDKKSSETNLFIDNLSNGTFKLLKTNDPYILDFKLNSKGTFIAVLYNKGMSINIFDCQTLEKFKELSKESESIETLSMSFDYLDNWLVMINSKGKIQLWSLNSSIYKNNDSWVNKISKLIKSSKEESIYAKLSTGSKNKFLIVFNYDGQILLIDYSGKASIFTIDYNDKMIVETLSIDLILKQ